MRYEAPDSLEAAAALLARESGEARVLAGGTDLVVQMRSDVLSPVLLVDIKRVAETRKITDEGGRFRIGAAVTGAEPSVPRGSMAVTPVRILRASSTSVVWPTVMPATSVMAPFGPGSSRPSRNPRSRRRLRAGAAPASTRAAKGSATAASRSERRVGMRAIVTQNRFRSRPARGVRKGSSGQHSPAGGSAP